MNTSDLTGSRRDFLWKIGGGLGGIAMTQMLARNAVASTGPALEGGLHHAPKARRVIQLFMTGGASPMDTFDYKPVLEKVHGKKLGPKEKPEGFTAMPGAMMKSPFEFKQHGESGRWVSSVFPHMAGIVDELGVKGIGVPLIQGIGGLDVVMAVKEDVRGIGGAALGGVGDDHRFALGLADGGLEACGLEQVAAHGGGFETGVVIGGVGRDALYAQKAKEPFQSGIVVRIDTRENVVHLAHWVLS